MKITDAITSLTPVTYEDVVEYIASVRVELLEIFVPTVLRFLLYRVQVHVLVDKSVQAEVAATKPARRRSARHA